MVKTFYDYIREMKGIEVPKGNISGEWFSENHIPMVVRCSVCEMTMASPSAYVDDEGYTYCPSCAEE